MGFQQSRLSDQLQKIDVSSLNFAADLEDSKSTSGEVLCISSEVEHLFPSPGCARSKRQSLAVAIFGSRFCSNVCVDPVLRVACRPRS